VKSQILAELMPSAKLIIDKLFVDVQKDLLVIHVTNTVVVFVYLLFVNLTLNVQLGLCVKTGGVVLSAKRIAIVPIVSIVLKEDVYLAVSKKRTA